MNKCEHDWVDIGYLDEDVTGSLEESRIYNGPIHVQECQTCKAKRIIDARNGEDVTKTLDSITIQAIIEHPDLQRM